MQVNLFYIMVEVFVLSQSVTGCKISNADKISKMQIRILKKRRRETVCKTHGTKTSDHTVPNFVAI